MADEALLTTPTSPPSIISTQDSPLLLSPTGLANSTPTHERSRKQIRRHSAPERHVQEDDIEVADRRRVTVHDPSRRDSFASATSEGSWLSTSFISDINLAARLSSPTALTRDESNEVFKHQMEVLEQEGSFYLEEQAAITRRRREAGIATDDGIAVAFSGGGIRSAAVCAGFLWALAERRLMKEVDFISTVSGGGYAGCSFITHLVRDNGSPARPMAGESLDAFLLRRYRASLMRMQTHCGYLVSWKWESLFTWCPTSGSHIFPRIFDVSMLSLRTTLLPNNVHVMHARS